MKNLCFVEEVRYVDDCKNFGDSDKKEDVDDSDEKEDVGDSDEKEYVGDSDEKEDVGDSDEKEYVSDSDEKEDIGDGEEMEDDSDGNEDVCDSDDNEDIGDGEEMEDDSDDQEGVSNSNKQKDDGDSNKKNGDSDENEDISDGQEMEDDSKGNEDVGDSDENEDIGDGHENTGDGDEQEDVSDTDENEDDSDIDEIDDDSDNEQEIFRKRHTASSSSNNLYTPVGEKVSRDKKNKKIFVRGIQTSLYNIKGDRKKTLRVWNQVHACKYCFDSKKDYIRTNISKHLKNKHRTEIEVKDILKESKKHGPRNKLVRSMWDLLRNKGDHNNNVKIMKRGKGEVILGRRYTGELDMSEYGPCPGCFVWIKINGKSLYRHQETCSARVVNKTEKEGTKVLRIKALQLTGKLSTVASEALKNEVFAIMTRDEITDIAQSDPLIIGLGNMWLLKNIGNRLKRKYYTSSHMRLAARLLMHVRNITGLEGGFKEFLCTKHFDDIVRATLKTASVEFDDDEDLKSPSTALKMGYDIKRMVGAKWGIALRDEDDKSSKECKDFLKLYKFEWSVKVTKLATVILQTRRFSKDRTLPEPDDLFKLHGYIKEEIRNLDLKDYSYKNFRMAEVLAQTRLLMYNKRRSGEVEVIK